MRSTTVLRQLLAGKGVLVAPGVYDGLTATIAARSGFQAVYMTGAGIAYSALAKPDIGLLTYSEMVERARLIVEACGLPVIADADTGYGNAINVIRTVRGYEQAGVAAIQLEDQVMPKKCGHLSGREVIPCEEMVGKIRAAVDARNDPDLAIVARTDARTTHGIEEAVRRGKAYAEAGADVVFIESPESIDEMKLITSAVGKPLLANMVEGGRTPSLTAEELKQIGYRIVIFPGAIARVVARAAADFYAALKVNGSTRPMLDKMLSFDELNRLLGLDEIKKLETKYAGERGVPSKDTSRRNGRSV